MLCRRECLGALVPRIDVATALSLVGMHPKQAQLAYLFRQQYPVRLRCSTAPTAVSGIFSSVPNGWVGNVPLRYARGALPSSARTFPVPPPALGYSYCVAASRGLVCRGTTSLCRRPHTPVPWTAALAARRAHECPREQAFWTRSSRLQSKTEALGTVGYKLVVDVID